MVSILRIFLSGVWIVLCVSIPRAVFAIELGDVSIQPTENSAYNKEQHTGDWFLISAQKGSSIENAVDVINNSTEPASVRLYAADGIPSSDGGFAAKQAIEDQVALGSWVQLSRTEFTIPPQSVETIPFTLSVPETIQNAQTEYTGAILLERLDKDSLLQKHNGLRFSTRIGSRVYLTIPGEIVEKIQLNDIAIQPSPESPEMLEVVYTIQNTGTVSKTIETYTSTTERFSPLWLFKRGVSSAPQHGTVQVLANDTAVYRTTIKKPLFGELRVHAMIQYTVQNGIIEEYATHKRMWIFPPYGIIILFVMSTSGCVVFFGLYRKKRKKEQALKK